VLICGFSCAFVFVDQASEDGPAPDLLVAEIRVGVIGPWWEKLQRPMRPVGFKYSGTGVELGLCGGFIFVDQAAKDLVSGDPVGLKRDQIRVVLRGA
jgi:hypothetical protein